jgi:hypothetical protein
MQAALYNEKITLDLITDIDIYNLIEGGIRGEFTSVAQPYKKFNNQFINNYDENKPKSFGLLLDFNSLYACALSDNLPYGNIYELNNDEILSFDYQNIDIKNDMYCYALEIDFNIPDDVKLLTDELPLGLRKKTPLYDELSNYSKSLLENISHTCKKRTAKLIACHENQTKYLISLELLQLYIRLGVNVTKIHRVIRFNQKSYFKNFIYKNINLRKNSKNSFEKDFYKLLSNSLFGKTLYNQRKHADRTSLVLNEKHFDNCARNPLLKRCIPIGVDRLLMTFSQDSIFLNSPIYVGFFILEKAKFILYSFFYNVLKKHYGDNVKLLYTDTDSLFLSFENLDNIYDEMAKQPLKDYLDTSNFSKDHHLFSEAKRVV